jgi:RimJ/RimL family protein N-acetyltransferase
MNGLEHIPITNFKTGVEYLIQSGNRLVPSAHHLSDIAEICNQDDVYALFKRWEGRAYSEDDAHQFLEWVASGWIRLTHFVFLVTTRDNHIVAALDIKSNDLAAAEIGYWCDQRHRGITSSAVAVMITWARKNGFRSLFADPVNQRSTALLERLGFVRQKAEANGLGRWTFQLDA